LLLKAVDVYKERNCDRDGFVEQDWPYKDFLVNPREYSEKTFWNILGIVFEREGKYSQKVMRKLVQEFHETIPGEELVPYLAFNEFHL
jgi:hypothetical protein